ncbi:Uncharacterised protein [uncultured archaeon]|nr:Uncharacterised protein [uncultured archaeon]
MDDVFQESMKKNVKLEMAHMKLISDPEYAKLYAALLKTRYDALMKAGFTKKEAFAIVLTSIGGEPPAGSSNVEE